MRHLLFAGAALIAAGTNAAEPVDLLIRSVAVIDVVAGRVIPDQAIAVRGDRIVAIGSDTRAGDFEARRTLDAAGKFAIPGLWDMHVHFGGGEALIDENRNLLPLYVTHGVTAVRDAAGDLSDSVLEWRAAVAAGKLQGPTIFTSGPKIEGYKSIWPGDIEIGSTQELNSALDRLQALKVDFIKITDDTLSPELFMSALAESRRRGLKTSAHIPLSITIDDASSAGLSSIEHLGYAYKAGSPQEREIGAAYRRGEITSAQAWTRFIATFDEKTAVAAYRRLAGRGTAVVPTLNGSYITAYLDKDDHASDEYLEYIGPGLQATYAWRVERAAQDDADAIRRRHERFEETASILPLLQSAGVRILAGTDAGFLNSFNYPGIGLHQELAVFVRYGLTPFQALQTATLHNSEFLGREATHGSLAAGKAADIVLLTANPLQDIAATRRIDAVILRGQVHDRAQLDAMLEDVRARDGGSPAPQ